jgi:hypothetical protein
MSKLKLAVAAASAASVAAVAVPAIAPASGGDDVRNAGTCSGSSTAKIKAKPDDGRIEVELEVDQNRNGVRWKVRLEDNGDVVVRGSRRTQAPSGSFSFERRIDNLPGTDSIKGIARNPASGERCVAKVKI